MIGMDNWIWLDLVGFGWIGLDWVGLGWIWLDLAGFGWIRLDKEPLIGLGWIASADFEEHKCSVAI